MRRSRKYLHRCERPSASEASGQPTAQAEVRGRGTQSHSGGRYVTRTILAVDLAVAWIHEQSAAAAASAAAWARAGSRWFAAAVRRSSVRRIPMAATSRNAVPAVGRAGRSTCSPASSPPRCCCRACGRATRASRSPTREFMEQVNDGKVESVEINNSSGAISGEFDGRHAVQHHRRRRARPVRAGRDRRCARPASSTSSRRRAATGS